MVRSFQRRMEENLYRLAERPKSYLRVLSLLVWSASVLLLYMLIIHPSAQSWPVWAAFAMFVLFSVIGEFLLRPARIPSARPLRRQVVVQQMARWRNNEMGVSLPPGTRFEIFVCHGGHGGGYGVRIKSADQRWITVAEYVSKEAAERLAGEANSRLCAW